MHVRTCRRRQTHACVHTYKHINMHAYMHTYTPTPTCTHPDTLMHAHPHTHTSLCMHTHTIYTHTHTHRHTATHTHAYLHTCTHAHTHTHTHTTKRHDQKCLKKQQQQTFNEGRQYEKVWREKFETKDVLEEGQSCPVFVDMQIWGGGSTAVVVMAMNASDWKLTLITTNCLVAGCCRGLRVGSKELHSSYESFSG